MKTYHQTVQKIKDLLDVADVPYKTFEHEAVRTSEEAAAIRPEYSLEQGAKALIVRVKKKATELTPGESEKQFMQIVVPGDAKFDPKKVRAALGVKDIRFATPEEVSEITDGVQPGGVPPFGNLFGLPVVVERSLLESNDEIIFNAGDRRFSIAIRSDDYVKVVSPKIESVI